MIDATTSSSAAGASSAQAASTGNAFQIEDFFKLLTAQLTAQDPLRPMEDTEFISQMANFSSLSQMEAVSDNLQALRSQQDGLAVQSLIGRDVTALTAGGAYIQGVVDHVEWVDGEPRPFIGDISFSYAELVAVGNAPVQSEA
ncbi:hypothetical protein H5P28_12165 [Ruficoccus amylovorans]|uniref:Basal-body rod modification protein FlgD n=1 Tax=Ruficoccus amylovorans TaxID=1804625 RepID=A0A842HER4_9BACT|nr:flagellar hook capping FlgD N-terminal domain-containing protein [Ruficoccus amylovorans]MBC2595013.1 hypothetical protein [Ruficoccus amylovorans]